MNDSEGARNAEVVRNPTAAATRAAYGTALRRARQKAGLSVADVAKVLKVAEHTVDALEAERYENLPPRPYIRGYIHRYARLVGLDAATAAVIVDAIGAPETTVPPIVPRPRRRRFADFARQSWGLLYGCIVLVFVVAIGSALWWASSGEQVRRDAVVGAARTPPAEHAAGAEAAPAGAEPPPGVPPAAVAEPLDAAVSDESPEVREPFRPDAATVASGDAGTGVDPVPAGQEPVDPDVIRFVFQEACWVEVHDRNDDLVHGDLGRPGDTLTLTGEAPFSVLVGYAAGVEITFNGERVDLAPATRGEVARLVVGD